MSGIITDIIECPQCKLSAQKDDYYVVGEEKVVCNWCGYTHLKTIEEDEYSRGFGTIHYVPKNKNGSNQTERIVRIKEPLDILDRHKIVIDIQDNYDIDKSSFYVWNENTEQLECLIGLGLPT